MRTKLLQIGFWSATLRLYMSNFGNTNNNFLHIDYIVFLYYIYTHMYMLIPTLIFFLCNWYIYVCYIYYLLSLTCVHCPYHRAPPPKGISSPPTTTAAVIPKVSSPYARQPVSHELAPVAHTPMSKCKHTHTHKRWFKVCKWCFYNSSSSWSKCRFFVKANMRRKGRD